MTIQQTLKSLNPNDTYYIIGIKGSGTSALAHILHDLGNHVEGSDIEEFCFTEVMLRDKNIAIHLFENSLPKGEPTIIYSAAYGEEHPQRQEAVRRGLPVYSYFEFLSRIVSKVTSIAVAGCHGKTTTTSFLSQLTKSFDPTYLIGDGTGKGGIGPFVFEACEYRNHFLHYRPTWAIINNVDFDHPDFFKDLNHVKDTFMKFGVLAKEGCIVGVSDETSLSFAEQLKTHTNVITYGFQESADYFITDVIFEQRGTSFNLKTPNETIPMNVPLFGKHNVHNFIGAYVVGHILGLAHEELHKQGEQITFPKRRSEEHQVGDQMIVDDYAHHPNEIQSLLQGVRQKYPNHIINLYFQPHTFSRTEAFLEAFAESFNQADHTYLLDIFGSAREKGDGRNVRDFFPDSNRISVIERDQIADRILRRSEPAVHLLVGAGDIHQVKYSLI